MSARTLRAIGRSLIATAGLITLVGWLWLGWDAFYSPPKNMDPAWPSLWVVFTIAGLTVSGVLALSASDEAER